MIVLRFVSRTDSNWVISNDYERIFSHCTYKLIDFSFQQCWAHLFAISIKTFHLIFVSLFWIECKSYEFAVANVWDSKSKYLHNSKIQFPHLILDNFCRFFFSRYFLCAYLKQLKICSKQTHMLFASLAIPTKGYWIKSKMHFQLTYLSTL